MSLVTIEELASLVPDGARLAILKEDSGAAMAATWALVRRGVRHLHLVCLPVSSLQADVLIGAGCVSVIETSAVSLGEFGAAPRFSEAVRTGRVRVIDGTCPAIYAGLQAAQKGIPFMPLRGIVESDLLAQRKDWKVIDNPFATGDQIVAIQAIQPDVTLFHAQAADRHGNVFLGRERDGMLLAHASRKALVTVEEIVEGNLMDDTDRVGAVLPALYVTAVAHAPTGAWPLGFPGRYPADAPVMTAYAQQARTQDGFEQCLRHLMDTEPVTA